ncbi:MAG: L,D-transpeptidase [Planctomycetota bacterium]|jgi:hypothetical protein
MRQLSVLLIAGALVWAYLKYFPANEPQAVEPTNGAAGGGVTQTADLPAPEITDPEPAEENRRPLPQTSNNRFAPASAASRNARAAVNELARALAHDDDGAFAGVLAEATRGIGENRARALDLFRIAVSGDVAGARAQADAGLLDELPARERALLEAALGAGQEPSVLLEPEGPLDRAMIMRLHAALAEFDALAGDSGAAARRFGRVLELEFDAPWAIDPVAAERWSEALRDVERRHRWDPRGDWPAIELVAEPGEGWIDLRKRAIAERPDLSISAGLIARANGASFEKSVRRGQKVRVPTDPVSVRIDVSSRWLLYMIGDEVVDSYEVGVGRPGEETLTGEFIAGTKQTEPVYWGISPPAPFGDPENPLGTRWIGWRIPGESSDTSYGLHGTWEPESIGHAASEGCVRMHNDEVEVLYDIIPSGAPIFVRD